MYIFIYKHFIDKTKKLQTSLEVKKNPITGKMEKQYYQRFTFSNKKLSIKIKVSL